VIIITFIGGSCYSLATPSGRKEFRAARLVPKMPLAAPKFQKTLRAARLVSKMPPA
jgi:hypothetical protein